MKVTEKTVTKLVGVTELARRTGYSVCHISHVLRGERVASRPLAATLRRMGYRVKAGERKYAKGGHGAKATA